jgi:hypothetical protein
MRRHDAQQGRGCECGRLGERLWGASAGTVGVWFPQAGPSAGGLRSREQTRRRDANGVREVPARQALTYTSNSATTASVSLSGLNSPAWASSTILIATSSATGIALGPFNRNRKQTCSKALCISSIWSGRKKGALRRRSLNASLNMEAPCATRPWCVDGTCVRQIHEPSSRHRPAERRFGVCVPRALATAPRRLASAGAWARPVRAWRSTRRQALVSG